MKHFKGVQVPQVRSGAEVWLKVLAKEHGRLLPCSGGKGMRYGKPVRKPDGSWSPGAWTDTRIPVLCHSGYHVTSYPKHWVPAERRAAVYWAECRGNRSEAEYDKLAFASIRLLRPVEISEVLDTPPHFWSMRLLRALLDPKILFLYLTALGLARTRNTKGLRPLEAARSYLLRCAAHRSVIGRDMDSAECHNLYGWGPLGSPTEIPRLLSVLQRNQPFLPAVAENHFNWSDVKRRVDPSLFMAAAPPAHIDMRTFRVVPTPPKL